MSRSSKYFHLPMSVLGSSQGFSSSFRWNSIISKKLCGRSAQHIIRPWGIGQSAHDVRPWVTLMARNWELRLLRLILPNYLWKRRASAAPQRGGVWPVKFEEFFPKCRLTLKQVTVLRRRCLPRSQLKCHCFLSRFCDSSPFRHIEHEASVRAA